jgi:hypothetical protein
MATAVFGRKALPSSPYQVEVADGFHCERCGHQKGWLLQTRHVYECAGCRHHTSVTAGTLFNNTKLPLVKWFWCIYWVSTDKGSISALRLTKLIGVS